jgi:hypothetical protein
MEKVGTEQVNLQVVYASQYNANLCERFGGEVEA